MILSGLKIAVYLTELHLMKAVAIARDLPLDPAPRHTPEQKRRLGEAFKQLWSDWKATLRRHPGASTWPRIGLHLRRLASMFGDLPRLLSRKRAANADDLAHVTLPEGLPAYYLKNYHYQTDGYLSDASALRYDHGVELLFMGIGHIVRKVGFDRLSKWLQPRARVLEFGAGTGTSGAQFLSLFPDAELTILEASPHYLAYAARTYPGRFHSLRQQAIESLEDEAIYDCVISSFTLHEIPTVHWPEIGRRLLRALKPGGLLLLVDSQQNSDDPANQFALDQFQRDFFEPYFDDYRATPLTTWLERSGFRILETHPLLFSKAVLATRPL
jgi:ubiquinone/menaquinone biosynthesis C-methylase UbiE